MTEEGGVTTWHHGLVASWWANFNLDGPEIEFFGRYVAAGQPALDVGCGSGRLLVPWVAAGLDVDGVDASADMIGACREAARGVGCEPSLYVQPTHLLDLPRRYATIVMCGSLGLGGTRDQDLEGLRRVHAHLAPSGLLALDSEVGEFDDPQWRSWQPGPEDQSVPAEDERRLGRDGFEYALRHHITSLDLDGGVVIRELEAWQWRDGELVAHERHGLVANLYTSDEIVGMLDAAGFIDVRVIGGYHGGEPTGDEEFLVYLATAP